MRSSHAHRTPDTLRVVGVGSEVVVPSVEIRQTLTQIEAGRRSNDGGAFEWTDQRCDKLKVVRELTLEILCGRRTQLLLDLVAEREVAACQRLDRRIGNRPREEWRAARGRCHERQDGGGERQEHARKRSGV